MNQSFIFSAGDTCTVCRRCHCGPTRHFGYTIYRIATWNSPSTVSTAYHHLPSLSPARCNRAVSLYDPYVHYFPFPSPARQVPYTFLPPLCQGNACSGLLLGRIPYCGVRPSLIFLELKQPEEMEARPKACLEHPQMQRFLSNCVSEMIAAESARCPEVICAPKYFVSLVKKFHGAVSEFSKRVFMILNVEIKLNGYLS